MTEQMAGWYPDPVTPAQLRYWDGTQWTEHIAAAPANYAPPAPQPYYGYGTSAYPAVGVTGPYASWGQRVGSYLLDALLVAPFSVTALILEFTNTKYQWIDQQLVKTQTPNATLSVIIWILEILGFAVSMWNIAYRQGTTGYSVGKQILGIKLVREQDGRPLGTWPAFGRNVLHILDGLPLFLGFLWPLWDAKRQTFADKLIHSVVLVEPKPKS